LCERGAGSPEREQYLTHALMLEVIDLCEADSILVAGIEPVVVMTDVTQAPTDRLYCLNWCEVPLWEEFIKTTHHKMRVYLVDEFASPDHFQFTFSMLTEKQWRDGWAEVQEKQKGGLAV